MSAATGIGCFKGCGRAVIGQCQGYEEACGSFYCAAHSYEKLCEDCGNKKKRDVYIEKTLKEYTEIAEKIPSFTGPFGHRMSLLLTLFFGGSFALYVSGPIVKSETDLLPWIGIIIALALTTIFVYAVHLHISKLNKNHHQQLQQAAQDKPQFAEFYKEWSKQTDAATRAKLLNAALMVGGAVEGYTHEKTRQEIHQAAKKINRS